MGKRKVSDRWRRDSREIAEYVRYADSMCSTFSTHAALTGRKVSEKARAVVEFLKRRRYLERSGCLSLLMDVHRDWVRTGLDTARDRIFDSIETELERYFEALSWEPAAWVESEELDANEWLFNCRNGTIDLRTGKVRAQERADFVTKVANVEYRQGADCPRWKRFLGEITGGSEELVSYIAKAAGWALTGDMSEQTMFILYGSGANGKSTLLNALLELFGDYAISAPTETFMRRRGEGISNDIARLRGTRLVTTVEAEEGKRLSEPLIKQVTGNDRMTARFLYGEYFDFQPSCRRRW